MAPNSGFLDTTGTLSAGNSVSCGETIAPPQPVGVVRPATIEKVSNGFIVRVGCKTLVADSFDKVAKGLKEYFDDPIKAEKKYCK